MRTSGRVAVPFVVLVASAGSPPAQESKAGEPTLAALPRSCWFLVPARQAPAPGRQAGLVVVLPGGG